MPWLEKPRLKSQASGKWQHVFKNAMLKRVSAEQLSPLLEDLQARYPLSPHELAQVLLSFRANNVGGDDPLLFSYADLLLRTRHVDATSLLLATLGSSRFLKRPVVLDNAEPRPTGLPSCEERIFNLLAQSCMDGGKPSPLETHGLVYALTRSLHAVTEFEMGKQLEGGALHSADAFAFGMYEALASLALTVLAAPAFKDVVSKQAWWRRRRAQVVSEMQNFDSHVLQWMQSQLGGRLGGLVSLPPFLDTDNHGRPVFSPAQILQSVPDVPQAHSRAGLFIWLNACLCSLPMADDLSVLTYLQARYSGETQILANDLLLACFDVLANSLLRKESDQTVKIVRSFICNKVPILLSMLAGFLPPPLTLEGSIQMAFAAIVMDALPPLSDGANEIRDKMKQTRLEFCQSCALHGLVSEPTVLGILGEAAPSSNKTKYTKENLLAQCVNSVSRLEPLIEELDGMAGNAGAISGCIIDLVGNLCSNKDTMSLKSVCNMLVKRVPLLDIILQYTQPAGLLLPLCSQLNEWSHDQDQTEFTASYEEFSSILLLVYAAVHRYGLQRSDLGLTGDDNFVAKLLQDASVKKPITDLTEDQSKQLGKWVEGLYSTDEHGEADGVGDEVMRKCPPQDFYMLVPTLFEQTIVACKTGALLMKAFKCGLELLVEPFLLPSLVAGLLWTVERSWETQADVNILVQLLDKLIRASSSSQDTKAMHKAVLAIVAKPLCRTLQGIGKKSPKSKEINSLMEILKQHLANLRTMDLPKTELDEWLAQSNGSLGRCIQDVVEAHVAWTTSVGPTPPPGYTHRLFVVASRVLGPEPVLDQLVAVLKDQTRKGNGPIAFDICTAMVTAPVPGAHSPQMGLNGTRPGSSSGTLCVRNALSLWIANTQKLVSRPASDAETLIRLNRCIEAQFTSMQMTQLPIPMPIQDPAADQIMADLGLTDGAVNEAVGSDPTGGGLQSNTGAADFGSGDLNSALGQSMDLGPEAASDLNNLTGNAEGLGNNPPSGFFDELNLDLDPSNPQLQNADAGGGDLQMGGTEQNADDDIFAGLDIDDEYTYG